MKITHLMMAFSWISGVSTVTLYAKTAQAQINIQQIATKTCAVMAGQQKPDRQSFQYLLLLDDDEAFGSGNPVAFALSPLHKRSKVNLLKPESQKYQG